MRIFHKLTENKNLSLALGFFDGVHFAHKKLISNAVELAHLNNIKSGVITFEKSPASYFGKNVKYICETDDKIELIRNLGVDYLYILDFEEFKDMSAKDYLENVIIKHFAPKFILTGYNHTFGKNKIGNSEFLKNYKGKFKYIAINEVKFNNKSVSSTKIKKLILSGDIKEANLFLDRNFSVKGTVVKGNQIASKLGYKTANIIWDNLIIKPKYGVYFGCATYKEKKYKALINFGIRPTIDKTLTETLEVHILDFNQDIYGEILKVEFISKIRDEIKFNSFEDLKFQIKKDILSIALLECKTK